jgi:curved DNA-binding protein CbpA
MIDIYYKELIKKYHPDLNGDSKASTVITKVINKLMFEQKEDELKNLYERI